LKGGDPLVFGRGGEEAEALRQAGIEFEIVPGVTAALGATAFAGIPLTHRNFASGVAFVTGHEQPDKPGSTLDWHALARFPGTLVIYMGVTRLAAITEALIAHGKDDATPAAAIQWGSTFSQRTVEAPLQALATAVREAGLTSPTLVVVGDVAVGDVVRLRSKLSWFERRPLFGRRVLVTRPRGQEASMVRQLEGLGASVTMQPTVEIREIADWQPVDRAISEIARYGWLVFTSVNGVRAFLDRLRSGGRDMRALGNTKLAAIGPATADALRSYHLEPDVVPPRFRSEGLVEALKDKLRGQRVLLARADRGRELLHDELARVADVDQVAVYTQVDIAEPDAEVLADLCAGRIDFVSLTSSNIARAFIRWLDAEARARIASGQLQLVTISPVTSATVREAGLTVAAESRAETAAGVVEAISELASRKKD
jgi:uroporphyrinogen III methyltransferase/synthase